GRDNFVREGSLLGAWVAARLGDEAGRDRRLAAAAAALGPADFDRYAAFELVALRTGAAPSITPPEAPRVGTSRAEPLAAGRKLHALECLIRGPKGSPFESPAALFEFVRTKQTELWFDRTCLRLELESVGELPGSPRVSLNVYGATICKDPGFAQFIEGLSW